MVPVTLSLPLVQASLAQKELEEEGTQFSHVQSQIKSCAHLETSLCPSSYPFYLLLSPALGKRGSVSAC